MSFESRGRVSVPLVVLERAREASRFVRSLPLSIERVEARLVAADAWEEAGYEGLAAIHRLHAQLETEKLRDLATRKKIRKG